MTISTLHDASGSFEVTFMDAGAETPVVLFAVGSGGVPNRYVSLLESCFDAGLTVVAPHFAQLKSPYPEERELTERASRLTQALLHRRQCPEQVIGVGHSIGATLLLALAGARLWLGPGQPVDIKPVPSLQRLALMAPPTGFFQAPGALDNVRLPIQLWVGNEDSITPPTQCEWLCQALQAQLPIELKRVDGAGHFSFMDATPPHAKDLLADKPAFIKTCSDTIAAFAAG